MFFYMYAALLCLDSKKIKDFQQQYIGMFMQERKKKGHGAHVCNSVTVLSGFLHLKAEKNAQENVYFSFRDHIYS